MIDLRTDRCTKSYCQWLSGYPGVPLPPYLVQQGMFRRKEGESVYTSTFQGKNQIVFSDAMNGPAQLFPRDPW